MMYSLNIIQLYSMSVMEVEQPPIEQVILAGRDLGISASCLRIWVAQADEDEGCGEGLSSGERHELAQLRRMNRQLEFGDEILRGTDHTISVAM